MAISYDLTCWYVNARRIVELTGAEPSVQSTSRAHPLADLALLRFLKEAAIGWMRANNPAPLEVQLTKGNLSVGSLFTHHSNFYFVGLGKVDEALKKGKPAAQPRAYSKLEDWRPNGRLCFGFHHEHLTSNSSWSQLTGQRRAFVLGLVTDISKDTIQAVPYVVANIVESSSPLGPSMGTWYQHLELQIDLIDSFQKVCQIETSFQKTDLNKLRDIYESEVKKALAEIISEPTIPKDWGGESSDLFTSHLRIEGKRIPTAFLLKGRSKFHLMTSAHLGKNGDQIVRLFDEPADLLVLQHCHEVHRSVRKQMRAFAQQMNNPRRFCIINGYDTLRLLTAYGKCGL